MNYQLVLDETISKLNYVPKLLLHACCAPCSSYVIEYLSDFFEITILYYNPNIDTEDEFNYRFNELKRFINDFKTKYPVKLVNLGYLKEEYERIVPGLENEPERGLRCLKCYELRLDKSFKYAKDNNFDYQSNNNYQYLLVLLLIHIHFLQIHQKRTHSLLYIPGRHNFHRQVHIFHKID